MSPILKTAAFLFIFLYLLPFMTALCCMFPVLRHVCFFGMMYFTSNEYSLNFYPMPTWRGTARGYAFTLVSLFAVPLFVSMCFSTKYKVRLFPPGSFFYLLYFLAILLSGMNAIHMQQWGFEVYKMFWMYITFLAAFNYLTNSKNLEIFVYSLCFILIFLFLFGLKQKYLDGRYQIRSTFPHQNSLVLYLELFGLLALGILMNERLKKLLFVLVIFAFCGSTLLVVFSFSRGGLVIYFGGVAIVGALSILFNGFSFRRLILMVIGLFVLLSVVGYALPSIILRFTKASGASKLTRVNLAIASKRIADDYRLGVGANNYSEYSGLKYEYAIEQNNRDSFYARTGNWEGSGRGGIVETIYLLVAAECGWWGLVTLVLWFLYYYLSLIISMFVLRKKPCSGFVIGLFGGLTCVYWHSTLEWSLKQYNNFAQQMILYALIGTIAVHRKSIKKAWKRIHAEMELAKLEKKRKKKRGGSILYSSVAAVPAPVVAGNALPDEIEDMEGGLSGEVAPLGGIGAPALPEADPSFEDPPQ